MSNDGIRGTIGLVVIYNNPHLSVSPYIELSFMILSSDFR